MSCKDCFNGCAETVSDQCVKYTGPDVVELGITTGDTLSMVEASLVENLISALDGTGIIMTIDPGDLCSLVSGYLPGSGDITLVDYISALLQSACDLQEQVTVNLDSIAVIEAAYSLDCITGVSPGDGTHAVLQAVITKLCAVDSAVTALALDVATNYVKTADLDQAIQDYLDTIPATNNISSRMVPNAVVEYYGSLSFFDATGAGTGDWVDIYLCNGENGTPDKRGRVPVGATNMLGTVPLNVAVDPAQPGNPTYTLQSTEGTNTVSVTVSQMPNHNHTTSTIVTDPGHIHTVGPIDDDDAGGTTTIDGANSGSVYKDTTSSTTGIGVEVTNAYTGGGEGHANIQPALGCYYIIYKP